MDSFRCNACGEVEYDEGDSKDVVDVGKIVDDLTRETVRETLRDFGVFPKNELERFVDVDSEKKSDRVHKILKIVDDVVQEHLKCASPSFGDIRKQAMVLFWIVARRLENEGIPVTSKDQSIILKRIWSYLNKAKVCPSNNRLEELEKEAEESGSNKEELKKLGVKIGKSIEDSIRKKIMDKLNELSEMCDRFSKSSSKPDDGNGKNSDQS
jgi:hypothetical protein